MDPRDRRTSSALPVTSLSAPSLWAGGYCSLSGGSTEEDCARVSTGVQGLDDVLIGGLHPNRIYLLEGHPGTGKTTIALQFMLEGARAGERCLYITLSETAEELRSVARSHGWSLDGVTIFELTPP